MLHVKVARPYTLWWLDEAVVLFQMREARMGQLEPWHVHHSDVFLSLVLFVVPQNMAKLGAGDLLMSFLGVVIISMGFRIYQQVRSAFLGVQDEGMLRFNAQTSTVVSTKLSGNVLVGGQQSQLNSSQAGDPMQPTLYLALTHAMHHHGLIISLISQSMVSHKVTCGMFHLAPMRTHTA